MSLVDLKFLILVQIGIDIAIIVVFIFLILKLRYINKVKSFDGAVKIFESLLTDADQKAQDFEEQLKEKHRLIKSFNEKMDKKAISLNVLLNRADTLLSTYSTKASHGNREPDSLSSQQKEIVALAKKGRKVEEIANMLSIPKGGVKLVLDLKKKFSQIGNKA